MGDKDDKYAVGPGKPPREHMWKKGGPSPNPKGRPRKRTPSTYAQLVDQILGEKVTLVSNGRRRRVPMREVLNRKLAALAIGGDLRALKPLDQIRKWGTFSAQQAPEPEVEPELDRVFTLRLEDGDTGPWTWEEEIVDGKVVKHELCPKTLKRLKRS